MSTLPSGVALSTETDPGRSAASRQPGETPSMSQCPDAEIPVTLLERFRIDPDDPQAWRLFVERYQPQIRRWCRARGLQDCDADDVAQDVLLKLFGAFRKFRYDPARSFRAWLRTVIQHAWSDFLTARRKDPGRNARSIAQIADSAEARSDLERRIEEAYDRELLAVVMQRIRGRVKPATWDAFRLTAIEGLPGAQAARELGIAVAHVFVARHRVQKMLQEEIRLLKGEAG